MYAWWGREWESDHGRDCLSVAEAQMLKHQWASEQEIMDWKSEAVDEVQLAVATAQKDPKPNPFKENWSALSSANLRELE